MAHLLYPCCLIVLCLGLDVMPRTTRVTPPPTVPTLVDDEIDTSPTSTSNEQRASSTSDINGVATAEQDDQDSTTIHLSSDLIHYFQSINVDSFSEEKKKCYCNYPR